MDFTSVESSNMNGVTYFNKYLLILTNKNKILLSKKDYQTRKGDLSLRNGFQASLAES